MVRLGDEPAEIARATVALARRAGPTVIVSTRADAAELLATEVDSVHVATTMGAAVQAAASAANTDAVLVVSARAVPDMDSCRAAAALLDATTGWVTGSSQPFNRDRFASDRREVIGAQMRRRAAAADLELWENDATLVRTDLLARTAPRDGRPWGDWLRDRRAEGLIGVHTDATLSLRAAPVAAGAYWPDAAARQRAAALDVASAAWSGPWRARSIAVLLLARELFALPLLIWLLLPVAMGDGFPFRADPWVCVGAVGATALLRWWSLRAALDVEPMPRADTVAALYHAPGSLAAPVTLVRRRLRPGHQLASTRPLVWAALVMTLIAGYAMLGHDPGRSASRVSVTLSLAMLGMLWAFTIRSLVERSWSRASYRVRVELAASVDGSDGRSIDGSPGGVSVRGNFPQANFQVGAEVQVELRLDDGSVVRAPAVVAARRSSRGSDLLGLELHPGPAALDDWGAQLLRSATTAPDRSTRPTAAVELTAGRGSTRSGVLDRAVIGAVVMTSVAVVAALVLVLLGFRPLVVRSGSMLPTYQVGDVVIVDQVRADQLRAGDVVSLEYYPEFGEGMTHRVRSVREVNDAVQVETRGDANSGSEIWTVAPDQIVGRVVATVPAIGRPATLVRTARVPLGVGVLITLAVVALVLRGRRPGGTPTGDLSRAGPALGTPSAESGDTAGVARPASAGRKT